MYPYDSLATTMTLYDTNQKCKLEIHDKKNYSFIMQDVAEKIDKWVT